MNKWDEYRQMAKQYLTYAGVIPFQDNIQISDQVWLVSQFLCGSHVAGQLIRNVLLPMFFDLYTNSFENYNFSNCTFSLYPKNKHGLEVQCNYRILKILNSYEFVPCIVIDEYPFTQFDIVIHLLLTKPTVESKVFTSYHNGCDLMASDDAIVSELTNQYKKPMSELFQIVRRGGVPNSSACLVAVKRKERCVTSPFKVSKRGAQGCNGSNLINEMQNAFDENNEELNLGLHTKSIMKEPELGQSPIGTLLDVETEINRFPNYGQNTWDNFEIDLTLEGFDPILDENEFNMTSSHQSECRDLDSCMSLCSIYNDNDHDMVSITSERTSSLLSRQCYSRDLSCTSFTSALFTFCPIVLC
jgi:hypothetical protein